MSALALSSVGNVFVNSIAVGAGAIYSDAVGALFV